MSFSIKLDRDLFQQKASSIRDRPACFMISKSIRFFQHYLQKYQLAGCSSFSFEVVSHFQMKIIFTWCSPFHTSSRSKKIERLNSKRSPAPKNQIQLIPLLRLKESEWCDFGSSYSACSLKIFKRRLLNLVENRIIDLNSIFIYSAREFL